ncbi:MAG: hypothetical protein ACP5K9_01630 [Candidatus Micrarchaeia archaeon]
MPIKIMQDGGIVFAKQRAKEDIAARRLSRETHVVNDYERLMKEVLLERGIDSYYELHLFPVSNNNGYLPDFVTCMRVDGRFVVFEMHSSAEWSYILKLEKFSAIYQFYTVLVSKHGYDRRSEKISNEIGGYWYLPNGVSDPAEYSKKKKELAGMVEEFIREKNPEILTYAEAENELKRRIDFIEVLFGQRRK